MDNVQLLKDKLTQKRNRLAAEEIRINLKERKLRTRRLIEIGGLVVKAKLDHLPTNTLFGALLTNFESLAKDSNLQKQWTAIGKSVLDQEEKKQSAVILKLDSKPSDQIRVHLRSHGLKWNKLREKWYGFVMNLDSLKEGIKSTPHNIEVIK
ncbi:MAG: conjugal transfer protein TraD [Alphaproteobacteria bacterium]